MDKTVAAAVNFGVGCFFLEAIGCSGMSDWFRRVEDALGEIGSIRDISVFNPGDIFAASYALPQSKADIRQIFQPSSGKISFKVSIPERIQLKLIGNDTVSGIKTTEFAVDLLFNYYGPVVFVECINPASGHTVEAAMSVAIVREYLRSELKKSDGSVELHIVGPSPFHCDFRMTFYLDGEVAAEPVELVRRRGYSMCTFNFSKLTPENGRRIVHRIISDELSIYYDLVRRSSMREDAVAAVNVLLDELIQFHQRQGFRAGLARIFRTSMQARSVILEVLRAEANEAADKKYANDATYSLTNDGRRVIFEEEIRRESEVSYLSELRAIRESASMLESGRTKEFEVAVISVSTLLGGIAGAIAALIAK